MKYFFDTEFIEDGKTIDLISIGIVAEDGREFYGINLDCDHTKANSWVKENVLKQLPKKPLRHLYSEEHREQGWYDKIVLADEVRRFLGADLIKVTPDEVFPNGSVKSGALEWQLLKGKESPEFWAYYADYDWVVFCQLFGTMMDLPEGFPMYCQDLKQEMDRLQVPLDDLPPQDGEHNALEDARWNKAAYDKLAQL